MDAIEFVKKFGLERAKREISYEGTMMQCNNSDGILDDLKQIVEAFDLVEKHGGIDSLNNLFYVPGIGSARVMVVGGLTYADAMKAIELVEKCNASD